MIQQANNLDTVHSGGKCNGVCGGSDGVCRGGVRIRYLDVIKCFAILIVIHGHVKGFGFGLDDTYSNPSQLMLYAFNMPIFFFVSGFLAWKDGSTKMADVVNQLKKKFLYLVVPAVVFTLFRINLVHGEPLTYTLEHGFGGYWFTITLFECFALFYLLKYICSHKHGLAALLLTISAVGVGIVSVRPLIGPRIIDLNHLLKYFQFFAFGVLARMYQPQYYRLIQSEWVKCFSLMGFFVLLYVLFSVSIPNRLFHLLRDVVLRYLGVIVVLSFFVANADWFSRDTRICRIINLVGRNSLAIYLLQYFFIPHSASLERWAGSIDATTLHIICFLWSAVIVAVCMCFILLLGNSKIFGKYALGKKS